jgi:methionyl-tRNA formyltransferase
MQLSLASSSLVSLPVLNAILESEHTLVSIITNPDKATGRGKPVVPNELAAWASDRNLPVAKPADTSDLNRHLLDAQPQCIVTVAYGRIIPVELLHGPRFGWINLHFSLLPKLRGAAPVQWSLLNGDTHTGFTIFKLDKGMDTGPVYIQEEVAIDEEDTTDSLLLKLGNSGARAIMELLPVIGKTRATPQPLTGATLAPKISREQGRISWQAPTDQILRQARALETRPGIWTTFNGDRLSLHGLEEAISANSLTTPGSIELNGIEFLVRTLDSVLAVSEVTPAGKKRMKASDFARGARLEMGSSFE